MKRKQGLIKKPAEAPVVEPGGKPRPSGLLLEEEGGPLCSPRPCRGESPGSKVCSARFGLGRAWHPCLRLPEQVQTSSPYSALRSRRHGAFSHLSAGPARKARGELKPGGPRSFQIAGSAKPCDSTYPQSFPVGRRKGKTG